MQALPTRHPTRHRPLILAAIVLATMAGQSQAATATANLGVTATIVASCTVTASQAVAFGAYAPSGANSTTPLDATGRVTSVCTTGTTGYITLGQGSFANAASTDAAPMRQMSFGGSRLAYQLYLDAGRAAVWANTTNTGASIVGNGMTKDTSVYGQIAAGQSAMAGNYTDMVVVTITY